MYHFSMFLKPGDKPYGNISNLELKDGYFGASLCSLFTEQLEDIRQSLICNMQRIVIYTLNMPPVSYTHLDVYKRQIHPKAPITRAEAAVMLCRILTYSSI